MIALSVFAISASAAYILRDAYSIKRGKEASVSSNNYAYVVNRRNDTVLHLDLKCEYLSSSFKRVPIDSFFNEVSGELIFCPRCVNDAQYEQLIEIYNNQ